MSAQATLVQMDDRHRRLQHALALLKARHAERLIWEQRCPVCEALFVPRRGGIAQRYCSRACQRTADRGRRR